MFTSLLTLGFLYFFDGGLVTIAERLASMSCYEHSLDELLLYASCSDVQQAQLNDVNLRLNSNRQVELTTAASSLAPMCTHISIQCPGTVSDPEASCHEEVAAQHMSCQR
jgi:hypothetical protein